MPVGRQVNNGRIRVNGSRGCLRGNHGIARRCPSPQHGERLQLVVTNHRGDLDYVRGNRDGGFCRRDHTPFTERTVPVKVTTL